MLWRWFWMGFRCIKLFVFVLLSMSVQQKIYISDELVTHFTHFNAQLAQWHNRQCLANRRFKYLFVASVHLFLFRCLFWMKFTIAERRRDNFLWRLALSNVRWAAPNLSASYPAVRPFGRSNRSQRSAGHIIWTHSIIHTYFCRIQSLGILTHSVSLRFSHTCYTLSTNDPNQLKRLQRNHKSFWKKLFFISFNQVAFIHNVSFLCSSIGE